MAAEILIETVQFKRGAKEALIAALVGNNKPLAGEPIFEVDTGKLKIGNGVQNYADLPYTDNSASSEDPRFVIVNPQANQALLYDETSGKWVNKRLADPAVLEFLNSRNLTLKGFEDATSGQMPVKSADGNLVWTDPVSTEELEQQVELAAAHAISAGNSAVQAGNHAAAASTSAGVAEHINQQTMTWVNEKFWWGDIEAYNKLTEINPDTFYFVSAGV